MTQGPLISVVIPVYNGEQYVKSCLDTMFAQTYKNLEIIVIDDGSSDRSGQIALQYPVKMIRLAENRGLSAARNTGIDAASGEYIHFMDVDDGINLKYYEQMAAAVVETNADIACGGMVNEKHSFKTWKFKKRALYHDTQDKLKATFVGKWGYVWRYLFRLDFIKKQGLRFEEGRFIEDLTFSLPAVYYAESVIVVPGAEYLYYHRENSIMNKKDKAHREKRRLDWSHAKAFRKEFSRKHNLKIPGIDTGRFAYLLRKLFR